MRRWTVVEAEKELRLRLGHALAHSGINGGHNHLNVDAFLLALNRYIDIKIKEEYGKRYYE